jgi:hypothetical protein
MTIWTEESKVLQTVIRRNAVDVIELESQRLSVPYGANLAVRTLLTEKSGLD